MNYYERHLGDYARDTGHLTMLEHGAYTLLLDRYYATEHGIPEDQAMRVARARSDDERAAVTAVLTEFFSLVSGVWMHGRVEGEIEKANNRIRAARENGKKGGNPNKKQAYNSPGYLYLADCGAKGTKVGITVTPPKRLYGLRQTHGRHVEFIALVQVSDMGRCEAQVLGAFAAFADGEMLLVDERTRREVVAYVHSLADHQPGGHPDGHPSPEPRHQTHQAPSTNLQASNETTPRGDTACADARPADQVYANGFEGNEPRPMDACTRTRIAIVATLRRLSIDGATAFTDDLRRYVAAGGTAEHVEQVAGFDRCRGKGAIYVLRAATSDLTNRAPEPSPEGRALVVGGSHAAPQMSKTLQAVAALEKFKCK